jgi:hypothetical protein
MAKKTQNSPRTKKAQKSDAPKTPQERDAILTFITEELLSPNNTHVEIDFNNPQGLDSEVNEFIKKKKIKRDRVGRPTKMTPGTLKKLKIAYLIDCTDVEACGYAGISHQTLYNFQEKNPGFVELKRKWKDTYIMAARLNVMRSVVKDGNMDDSWKALRAKRRNEYAEKTIVQEERTVSTDELEKIPKGEYEQIEEKK